MASGDHSDALKLLYDDCQYSEEELELVLLNFAELRTGAYETLLHCLVTSTSNITRPTLELILSARECGTMIRGWLNKFVQQTTDPFTSKSLIMSILVKLSLSLPFLHAFDREVNSKLSIFRANIEHSPVIIDKFVQIICNTQKQELEFESEEKVAAEIPIKTKRTQRERKAARNRSSVVLDSKLTKALHVWEMQLPLNESEATDQLLVVTRHLLHILKFYLSLLENAAVATSIRQIFVKVYNDATLIQEEVTAPTTGPSETEQPDSPSPAAYPMVQPMKAALYFDSADGFGEWRILISTRADRNLREARRQDKKFFTIIIKKIKELSNGHFSDDNQKRLTNHTTEIPIFEAKMTRDSRLVYQVDCIPEYDSDIERQVIKIFGIYTHAQIDNRLWDSISYQLSAKGSEYRRRCIFRNPPTLVGDNVFTPASFPPAEKELEETYVMPELPQESLEEMHSLLVLEKFVAFSQALLNSIIADLDVAHVFNVSPAEMEIIQHPSSCYVLGRSGTGKTTTMLFKMLGIERAYVMQKDSMQKPRQIFVTKSRVLATKVEEYFSKLLDSLSTAERTKEELAELIKVKRQAKEEEGLVDLDDVTNWRADLPSRFSQLSDEHFPLFLTFDRLVDLLEADISNSVVCSKFEGVENIRANRKLIDYDAFLVHYWPHFSQAVKKGLDPALVYSEIMGIIQGSEESLSSETQYLSKTTYESLSFRAQNTFANRREVVYNVFLMYLKRKKANAEYDSADRTHSILKAFQATGIPGQKLDYLYVDEAQDNLLIDALLLRSLMRNPDGLFWAGDTAQTISVGSSFRFNDLKAFLFRLEERRNNSRLLSGSSSIVPEDPPRTFQLATNYRSHAGIVQCAHSVIELITEFWPYAIDIMSRERGVVDGTKPVFFSGWDKETVRYEQFLFGESGSPIEFGAQQCILVRHEAAKEELRSQVGEIGLIMTLYESKGLEFDDVLLYKFFEDSTIDLSQWRVVLNMIKTADGATNAPRFDDARHAGVCSDLKFLYVAITRARKNLWIVDCSEKSEPMRVFWTVRDEIQNCTPGTEVPRLAVSSTPEEWERTGRNLFSNKRYLQAMHCFERAGMEREAAASHTYYLREQARSTVANGSKQSVSQRQKAFVIAAESFMACALSSTKQSEKTTYLRNAGACYEEGEEDFEAANAYRQAREFTQAAKLYKKCAKFDEAVDVVTLNREQMQEDVATNIIDIAKLFYFRNNELEKASQLFQSVDEQLEYLEDFDLDVSRAAVLESLGKYQDAAEIHLAEGRVEEAIRLFLKDEKDLVAIRRAEQCILQGLWENSSFAVASTEKAEKVERLLKLASPMLSSEAIDSVVAEEFRMFKYINTKDRMQLRALGRKFDSLGKPESAILCFDNAFKKIPFMFRMPAPDISEFLQDFLLYCRLLYGTANIADQNPCNNEDTRKLFSIHPPIDNSYLLPTGTFLYERFLDARVPLISTNDEGIVVSDAQLARRFKDPINERVLRRIRDEVAECQRAQALTPCIVFMFNNGLCNRRDCPFDHLALSSVNEAWYNQLVRMHLQQILIVQGLIMLPCDPIEKIRSFRFWLGRLFDALHPPHFRIGNFAKFNISSVPEGPKALRVVKLLCQDLFFWPKYGSRDPKILTAGYQAIKFGLYVDRNLFSNVNIALLPLTKSMFGNPDLLRKSDDIQTVILPEVAHTLSGNVKDNGFEFGILFIQHVIQKPLVVDANVFFNFIDIVCGMAVLLHKNQNLHGSSLPLSWLTNLLGDMKIDVSLKPLTMLHKVNSLINNLRDFLEQLSTVHPTLERLLCERSDLYKLPTHRNLFTARLCRAICLVGYNINHEKLRSNIMNCLRVMRRDGKTHPYVRDYASPRNWIDVTRALTKSTKDCPMDELILLSDAKRIDPKKAIPLGMRRVIYKNVVDIPSLLDGTSSFSNLRANAPAFVPKPVPATTIDGAEDAEIEPETEEPEVDNTEIVVSTVPVDNITITQQPGDTLAPSEEQIRAVQTFEMLYRRLKRRRQKDNSKTATDVSRDICFEACLAESLKIEWPTLSPYRFLFLGPLPHILVCLNALHSWAMENKSRNKKKFKTATDQELDDVNKRLTEQKKTIEEIRILQKAINPQAHIHRKRDAEELRQLVRQCDEMIRRIAPTVARNVSEDLDRGLKGIVAIKQPPKPKPKPILARDEDTEVYDDHDDTLPDLDNFEKSEVVQTCVPEDGFTSKKDAGVVMPPSHPSRELNADMTVSLDNVPHISAADSEEGEVTLLGDAAEVTSVQNAIAIEQTVPDVIALPPVDIITQQDKRAFAKEVEIDDIEPAHKLRDSQIGPEAALDVDFNQQVSATINPAVIRTKSAEQVVAEDDFRSRWMFRAEEIRQQDSRAKAAEEELAKRESRQSVYSVLGNDFDSKPNRIVKPVKVAKATVPPEAPPIFPSKAQELLLSERQARQSSYQVLSIRTSLPLLCNGQKYEKATLPAGAVEPMRSDQAVSKIEEVDSTECSDDEGQGSSSISSSSKASTMMQSTEWESLPARSATESPDETDREEVEEMDAVNAMMMQSLTWLPI